HLVGLCRQPDGLGHRRAGLLAELAEHAALQVHVEAVEHLDRLARPILLVVPVDVDDVDRAFDRAQRALDAALLVEPEHPAESVRTVSSPARGAGPSLSSGRGGAGSPGAPQRDGGGSVCRAISSAPWISLSGHHFNAPPPRGPRAPPRAGRDAPAPAAAAPA